MLGKRKTICNSYEVANKKLFIGNNWWFKTFDGNWTYVIVIKTINIYIINGKLFKMDAIYIKAN